MSKQEVNNLCHHDMCMREATAREFALGIGKGGGICSRHGATVDVVRKNCIHEDCTGVAFKGDYCKSHSKVMKSGNRRKTKSQSDLQRELDQFTAENIHNLDHFKQAYRNQTNAWYLEHRMRGKPYEDAEACRAIIRKNKEFASKQKKIIDLEYAIRRKRHQEGGYCRDERCRRKYCKEERRRIKMKAEEEEKMRQRLLARKLAIEEDRRKYWRCPNGVSGCHELLERQYKNLATTCLHPCDLRRHGVCEYCCAIEWEEWNAREKGIERLKPHLTWHCYRMLKPDTPRKRRVVLGVLKEGKKIVAWPDWRDDMTHLLVQPHQTEELAKGIYHPGVYCKAHYKSISDSEFELIGVCPPYYSEWQKAGEMDHRMLPQDVERI
jgi:hypothetical protein